MYEEFAEAYKDNTGKYSETEALRLLKDCIDYSYQCEAPLPDIVLSALATHIGTLLECNDSWLLRKADKRHHNDYVVDAKRAAASYVKANPGTTKTVATLYGVSPRTIQRWAEKYDAGTHAYTMEDLEVSAKDYEERGASFF